MRLTKGVRIAVLCAAGAALAMPSYWSAGRGASQLPLNVSLVQLVATPERYDGKLVNVVGFLSYGGADGDGLYFGKEDYENGVMANSLWVARTKEMWKDREKLYDRYVAVTGVFHADQESPTNVPHLAGRITEIRRCAFVSDPEHPMAERLKALPGVQMEPQN